MTDAVDTPLPDRDTLSAWAERWRAVLPLRAALPAAPRGIVLHWTGGGAEPNPVDRQHYHAIVGQSLRVVAGARPVAENMRKLGPTDRYAAHTGGFNSFRVGLAASGMRDATLRDPGPEPLTAAQVDCLLLGAALACLRYGLTPRNATHLCTHHEVWTLHRVRGTENHRKIDIALLAFRRDLAPDAVGPWLRLRAGAFAEALRFIAPPAPPPAPPAAPSRRAA